MGNLCSCIQTDISNIAQSDSSVELFTLENKILQAKVVYVYDGDTIHIVTNIESLNSNNLVKFNCRLAHIDCPEMSSKVNEEKLKAVNARNFLLRQVCNQEFKDEELKTKNDIKELCKKSTKLIWIKCLEFDKYGRLLVEIYNDNQRLNMINQLMITNKYALSYEGKTKETFDTNNFK